MYIYQLFCLVTKVGVCFVFISLADVLYTLVFEGV